MELDVVILMHDDVEEEDGVRGHLVTFVRSS